ncbi:hypothetical protein S225a_26210 [Candidatus Brocadiaceae bacterium S225]|uniref:Uncharacterized protein n=1 Tax=Candidatus Scalindua brodae TaxID=237368 RepID=A0A0B0EI97_9BACT|nr:MAG: hypothetical protein SCABRO_03422 [Candidatus Scalindua brodae]TWU29097.1 hypothetical protein S225a_26210 [Candidatus Brocadiaceae bacterium S225]
MQIREMEQIYALSTWYCSGTFGGSIPILLHIKEVDSLRLIHPTSHHTFAYL